MSILRATSGILGTAALAALASVSLLAGQEATGKGADTHHMGMGGSTMTTEEKIANASSAAPAAVSGRATIYDWPAREGGAPAVLRAGTNGWSCFPDMPETTGSDPMCIDRTWMTFIDAYLKHTAPRIATLGIGYMLAPGGAWGSNTDPYAMAEAAGNEWTLHAPHVMIAVPDVKTLEGMSTDPKNGGPYVMWKGTPYAHIMAPVATTTAGARTGQ